MSAPAGWHPQGDGRERFWDGSQWTDQFRMSTPPGNADGPATPQAGRRSWFSRHKVLTGLGALVLIIGAASVAAGGGGRTNDSTLMSGSSMSATPSKASTSALPSTASSPRSEAVAPLTSSTAATKSAAPAGPPPLTGAQQNAARSAQDYLAMSGFSRLGLIEQLSSSAGDGYSRKDATVAVDSLHVNWNAQAVRSAKDYLSMSGFSCSGLIEQLSSTAGDRYTRAQASYGAHHAGAC